MKSPSPQEREMLLLSGLQQLLSGALTEGKLLRKLRKEILAMNQDEYAALVGISRRTLSDIENDTGSQSITLINSIFKPFGLRLGLLPTSHFLLTQLLEAQSATDLSHFGKIKVTGFNRKK